MKTVNPINLSSGQLEDLLRLQKEREELQTRLAELSRRADEIMENPENRQRVRRGTVKGGVMGVLAKAGADGLHVEEIIKRSGLSKKQVESWLYSRSAHDTEELEKISTGVFRFREVKAKRTAGK